MIRARLGGGGVEPAAQDGHGGMIGRGTVRAAYVHVVHARPFVEPDRVSVRHAPVSKPDRTLVAGLIALIVAAACQSIPAVASLVPAAGPLVTVTVRGGECVNGPCGGTTVIERDGRVHQTEPAAAELGQLSDDVRAALDAAVKTTDFDVIRARKFTGECPVAFDGQEFIYEFGAPGGVQRIATCETEIDPNSPVFLATAAALGSVVAEPN